MKKKENKKNKRGWEALEIILQEQGLTELELEEARNSFYKGIETLSKMFLSQYLVQKKLDIDV
ncbi:hypothetical protein KAW08_05330 [bacterium]|nr:hypothetical protein [bacterium]